MRLRVPACLGVIARGRGSLGPMPRMGGQCEEFGGIVRDRGSMSGDGVIVRSLGPMSGMGGQCQGWRSISVVG